MKKINSLFSVLFLLVLSFNIHAQSKPGAAYFAGTWSVLLKGLPDGDKKMVFVLENMNDSITGVIQDTAGVKVAKVSSVALKENEIILYFTAQGYDVNLLMIKKDDDHTTGNLMSMFDAEGTRVKKG